MYNKDKIEALTQALLKYETLDAEEVGIILEGKELDKPTVSDLLKLEQEKAAEESMQKNDLDDEDKNDLLEGDAADFEDEF